MATGDKLVNLDALKAVHDADQTEITDLKSALRTGADLTPIVFTDVGKYIWTSTATIDFAPIASGGSAYKCVVVDCSEGDQFTVNGTGSGSTSGSARLWAFAKADGTRLSVAPGGITGDNLVITAPTGAEKLVLNNRIEDAPCFYGESVAIRMNACEDRITTIETKNKYLIVPEFEVGNIIFYNDGSHPAYGSSTTRARTPEGYDLELLPGTVVGLTDYSGAEFYIGYYSATSGKWVKNGWRTSDYVVTERGVYALLIRNNPEVTITNIDTIKSLLRITATFDAQYNAEVWTGEKENASKIASKTDMMLKANKNIRTIGHRGWTTTAPENTIPSFKQAKLNGCDYVETDIAFTSDGVAVLLHDTSINRTARNADGTSLSETVNIADITYETALTYDFGIWKGEEFAGTKIPTFEELLIFAKRTGLKIYAELKDTVSYTQAQVKSLVDSARKYGMQKNVSWISFLMNHLAKVLTEDSTAEIGYVTNGLTETQQGYVTAYITAGRNIFVDCNRQYMTDAVAYCAGKGIPLDTWTYNSAADITSADPIVRGFTANGINAASVLYDNAMA